MEKVLIDLEECRHVDWTEHCLLFAKKLATNLNLIRKGVNHNAISL
jgi:hypothetical protein